MYINTKESNALTCYENLVSYKTKQSHYLESGLSQSLSGFRRPSSNVIFFIFSSSLLSWTGRVVPAASSVFLELILSLPILWAPTLWLPALCSEEVSLPTVTKEKSAKWFRLVFTLKKYHITHFKFRWFKLCNRRRPHSGLIKWENQEAFGKSTCQRLRLDNNLRRP